MIFTNVAEESKRSRQPSPNRGSCNALQTYVRLMWTVVMDLVAFVVAQVAITWDLVLEASVLFAGLAPGSKELFQRRQSSSSHGTDMDKRSLLKAVSPSAPVAASRAKDLKVPHLDFVMPMKSVGMVTRAVVEGIHKHYAPRRLFVVCEAAEAAVMYAVSLEWNIPRDFLLFVNEDLFFVKSFNMRKEDFLPFYDHGRDRTLTREFGWWWQQLLKIGCASCIENISEDFIVWDSDLVVLEPWPLEYDGPAGSVHYAAVLQERARSSFNRLEYEGSVRHILGLDAAYPQPTGTYVAHHMPMNRGRAAELLDLMDARLPGSLPWPAKLLQTSSLFYRMSEYMLYSTFELARQRAGQPARWSVHPYEDFGARGFRHREPKVFMDSLQQNQGLPWSGYSYEKISAHLVHWRATTPEDESEAIAGPWAHLQLEHVYGLPENNPLLMGI